MGLRIKSYIYSFVIDVNNNIANKSELLQGPRNAV